MRPNNICCIGGSSVGGLSCCVIAFKCPEVRVVVVDKKETISKWDSNSSPFNEPGLDQILKKCRYSNLFFSSDYASSIRDADMIFLPINVPIKSKSPGEKQELDFRDLEEAAKLIAAHSESDKIVVDKSDVCARAVERVCIILESYGTPGIRFEVISNPTNLHEGSVIQDLLTPKCVLIGCKRNPHSKAAVQSLCDLYEYWVPRNKIKILDTWTADICSLGANLLFAQEVSSMNGLANICEELDGDVTTITKYLQKDSGVMTELVKPSLGLGGFHKDLHSFILMCDMLQLPEVASYWKTILDLSVHQTNRFLDKVRTVLSTIEGNEIGILGFAHAKNTIETKYSPAIEVCEWLLENNYKISIYDPQVTAAQIHKDLNTELLTERKERVEVVDNVNAACTAKSAVILCTDWDEFKNLEFSQIAKWVNKPVFIDGHTMWRENRIASSAFEYHTIGYKNKIAPNVHYK